VIASGSPKAVLKNKDVIASYLGSDDTTIKRSGTGGPRRRRTPTRVSTAEYARLHDLSVAAVRGMIRRGDLTAVKNPRGYEITVG
jgi:hypothetical protein